MEPTLENRDMLVGVVNDIRRLVPLDPTMPKRGKWSFWVYEDDQLPEGENFFVGQYKPNGLLLRDPFYASYLEERILLQYGMGYTTIYHVSQAQFNRFQLPDGMKGREVHINNKIRGDYDMAPSRIAATGPFDKLVEYWMFLRELARKLFSSGIGDGYIDPAEVLTLHAPMTEDEKFEMDKKGLISIMDELRQLIPPPPEMVDRGNWNFDVQSKIHGMVVNRPPEEYEANVDWSYPMYIESRIIEAAGIKSDGSFHMNSQHVEQFKDSGWYKPEKLLDMRFNNSRKLRNEYGLTKKYIPPTGEYRDLFNYWFHLLTLARRHFPEYVDPAEIDSYHVLDIPVGMPGLEHFTTERRMTIKYVDIYGTNDDGEEYLDYKQTQLIIGLYDSRTQKPIHDTVTFKFELLQNSYHLLMFAPYKSWPLFDELSDVFEKLAEYKNLSFRDLYDVMLVRDFIPNNPDIYNEQPDVGGKQWNYINEAMDNPDSEENKSILVYEYYSDNTFGKSVEFNHIPPDGEGALGSEVMIILKPTKYIRKGGLRGWPGMYLYGDAFYTLLLDENIYRALARYAHSLPEGKKPTKRDMFKLLSDEGAMRQKEHIKKGFAAIDELGDPWNVIMLGIAAWLLYNWLVRGRYRMR